MSGFSTASVETLLAIRANLLAGLDLTAASLGDGSFNTVGANGAAPPSQSGQLTLALLAGVDAELKTRTASTARKAA